jgi:hypothetical protein
MPLFCDSGSGDGGPIPLHDAQTKHSSTFYNFCNGSMPLYYFYHVLIQHGLLESTVSSMPEDACHSSNSTGSLTRFPEPRSTGKRLQASLESMMTAPVRIERTEDELVLLKAKRKRADDIALVAEIKTSNDLIAMYHDAKTQLDSDAGDDPFFLDMKKRALLRARASLMKFNGINPDLPDSSSS